MAITLEQFANRWGTWPGASQKSVMQSMRFVRDRARVIAVRNIAKRSKTGRLKSTIRGTGPYRQGVNYVVGLTAGSTSVRYARIQEFGGTIKHPGASGKLQVFEVRGQVVFTMYTRPHSIKIPARPYIRPALKQAISEAHPAKGYIAAFKRHVFGHA